MDEARVQPLRENGHMCAATKASLWKDGSGDVGENNGEFLQTNKIITNSQCKQRIPSKSQNIKEKRCGLDGGSHARQRRNATWAVWHFLQRGQSCGTRSIDISWNIKTIWTRKQQLRSQQINESRTVTTITEIQNAATAQPTWIEVRSISRSKCTLQLEVWSLLGWHRGLPPPFAFGIRMI